MSSTPGLRQNIFLIGDIDTQIVGNKLPSKLQVLKVLFFYLRELNQMTLRESATMVIDEVIIFWQKAQLPTKQRIHCIEKLESLYQTWRRLQKIREKPFNKPKEDAFTSQLKTLFDIAHANVFERIDEVQKEFLLNQRKPERIGYISNIEPIYEQEKRIRLEQEELRKRRLEKLEEQAVFLNEIVELASSGDVTASCSQKSLGTYSNVSLDDDETEWSPEDLNQSAPPAPKRSRGTINIFDEKLVAVLDRCKISDRQAVHLVVTIAQRLNYDASTLIINKSSINRHRERLREAKARNIKKVFQELELKAAVLQWDGKLLPNLLKRQVLDRLPVVITNGDTEKLLGIPELDSGTGEAQATAIHEVLEDWGVSESIKALCCDTTASNLGTVKGAATLLERILRKDLLYIPCRHHIFELVLKAVFDVKMPASSGPEVPIFKRFNRSWSDIDQSKSKSGMQSETVKNILQDHVQSIRCFVEKTQTVVQPRDDYKELLDLTLIFLGVVPPSDVKFRSPGGMHHARWKAKALYCLKIYVFRDCFKLTASEEKGIREICIFIVMVYIKAWFTCPLAPQAPNHDLRFIKTLHDYGSIDSQISKVTVNKFINHLWYLSPETIAMSFFDESLSIDLKRRMAIEVNIHDSLDDEMRESCPKRLEINHKEVVNLLNKDLDHFITPHCLMFFKRFGIGTQFLNVDPSEWNKEETFQQGLAIITKLKVVNDPAERAVRLIDEYNNILTNNETQKQYILQLVSEHRKQFPDAKKKTAMRDFL